MTIAELRTKINHYVTNVKLSTIVTGYWLNVILNDILNLLSGSGGIVSLPIDNFVAVNPLGNDVTGVREDFSKPFATLNAAKNAAIAGDTIWGFGGIYNESNPLHKDDVKWHFVGKPILNLFSPTVWGDGNVETVIEITGDAIINHAVIGQFLNIDNPNTIVHVDFHKVTGLGNQLLHLKGGGGVINVATSIDCTLSNQTIELKGNASYTINIPNIINSTSVGGFNYAIGVHNTVSNPYTGYTVINTTKVTKTASHPTGPIIMQYENYPGTLVINVSDKIEMLANDYNTFPPTRQCVLSMGGNLIINGNIDGGFNPAIALGANSVKSVEHNGKAFNGNVAPCIAENAVSGFWANSNGTLKLNGIYESDSPVTIEAGATASCKTFINGRIVNKSTDAGTTSGVKINNNMGSVIFKTCEIIMDLAAGTPECISASVAKDIKIFNHVGSNASKNANVTNIISGTDLTVDSDYE